MSKLAKYKELKWNMDKFNNMNELEAAHLRKSGWTDLQIVASGISGYEPNKPWSSARDDYYYDKCPLFVDKLNQIAEYSRNVYGIYNLGFSEIQDIQVWLDAEFACADDRYHAFKKLGAK